MAVKEKVKTEEELLPAVVQGVQLPVVTGDFDFDEYEGAGFENVTVDDMSMPWILVLDGKSPQCAPPQNGGVKGARAGMLCNKVTNQLFDGEEGVGFLPVSTNTAYVEFYPKEEDGSGGGFVGVRSPDDPIVQKLRVEQGKFGKLNWQDPDGNPTEIIETKSVLGFTVTDWNDPSTARRAVVAFKSTAIRAFNDFVSASGEIRYKNSRGEYGKPYMWSHKYRLRSRYKTKGTYNWYVHDLQIEDPDTIKVYLSKMNPFFKLGEELYKSIRSGAVRVEHEKMDQDSPASASSDVPF